MSIKELIGDHPLAPHPCGVHFSANDGATVHNLLHRQLMHAIFDQVAFTKETAKWIVNHHLSKETIDRDRVRRQALQRQGFTDPTKRFPTNESTRKGNWAEIFLAEYIQATGSLTVPIYRLRYNPNVDQSMKGDDMLAFDLDSEPVRILVGEAKFRGTPTKAVVEEVVNSLEKSHAGNIPASLQFVADRLFETGNVELGARVAKCSELFAIGQLSLGYIGLLVSNSHTHRHVTTNGKSKLTRIALMSLGFDVPNNIVSGAFSQVEELL